MPIRKDLLFLHAVPWNEQKVIPRRRLISTHVRRPFFRPRHLIDKRR